MSYMIRVERFLREITDPEKIKYHLTMLGYFVMITVLLSPLAFCEWQD